MASTSTQRPSTYDSSSRQKDDVFISFSGEDTRNSFTDHLRDALIAEGYNLFDDEKMERGKLIWGELVNAVEESRISVVVLSRKYASSSWCLDELVKIVQCRNDMGQTIIPVYYDVSSSEVKEGIFEEALKKTSEGDTEKIQTWSSAMRKVTNLDRWELEHRRESKFIKDIVKDISNKLRPSGSRLMNLENAVVGAVSCLEELRMQGEANLSSLQWEPTLTLCKYAAALFIFLLLLF